jgi:hypothetical protein
MCSNGYRRDGCTVDVPRCPKGDVRTKGLTRLAVPETVSQERGVLGGRDRSSQRTAVEMASATPAEAKAIKNRV